MKSIYLYKKKLKREDIKSPTEGMDTSESSKTTTEKSKKCVSFEEQRINDRFKEVEEEEKVLII